MLKLQRIITILWLLPISHSALAVGPEPTSEQLEKTVRAWFAVIESQFKETRELCIKFAKPDFKFSNVGGHTKEKALSDCAQDCGPDYSLCSLPFTPIKVEKIKCVLIEKYEYYACAFVLIAETQVPLGQASLKRFVDSNNIARGIFSVGPDGWAFASGW